MGMDHSPLRGLDLPTPTISVFTPAVHGVVGIDQSSLFACFAKSGFKHAELVKKTDGASPKFSFQVDTPKLIKEMATAVLWKLVHPLVVKGASKVIFYLDGETTGVKFAASELRDNAIRSSFLRASLEVRIEDYGAAKNRLLRLLKPALVRLVVLKALDLMESENPFKSWRIQAEKKDCDRLEADEMLHSDFLRKEIQTVISTDNDLSAARNVPCLLIKKVRNDVLVQVLQRPANPFSSLCRLVKSDLANFVGVGAKTVSTLLRSIADSSSSIMDNWGQAHLELLRAFQAGISTPSLELVKKFCAKSDAVIDLALTNLKPSNREIIVRWGMADRFDSDAALKKALRSAYFYDFIPLFGKHALEDIGLDDLAALYKMTVQRTRVVLPEQCSSSPIEFTIPSVPDSLSRLLQRLDELQAFEQTCELKSLRFSKELVQLTPDTFLFEEYKKERKRGKVVPAKVETCKLGSASNQKQLFLRKMASQDGGQPIMQRARSSSEDSVLTELTLEDDTLSEPEENFMTRNKMEWDAIERAIEENQDPVRAAIRNYPAVIDKVFTSSQRGFNSRGWQARDDRGGLQPLKCNDALFFETQVEPFISQFSECTKVVSAKGEGAYPELVKLWFGSLAGEEAKAYQSTFRGDYSASAREKLLDLFDRYLERWKNEQQRQLLPRWENDILPRLGKHAVNDLDEFLSEYYRRALLVAQKILAYRRPSSAIDKYLIAANIFYLQERKMQVENDTATVEEEEQDDDAALDEIEQAELEISAGDEDEEEDEMEEEQNDPSLYKRYASRTFAVSFVGEQTDGATSATTGATSATAGATSATRAGATSATAGATSAARARKKEKISERFKNILRRLVPGKDKGENPIFSQEEDSLKAVVGDRCTERVVKTMAAQGASQLGKLITDNVTRAFGNGEAASNSSNRDGANVSQLTVKSELLRAGGFSKLFRVPETAQISIGDTNGNAVFWFQRWEQDIDFGDAGEPMFLYRKRDERWLKFGEACLVEKSSGTQFELVRYRGRVQDGSSILVSIDEQNLFQYGLVCTKREASVGTVQLVKNAVIHKADLKAKFNKSKLRTAFIPAEVDLPAGFNRTQATTIRNQRVGNLQTSINQVLFGITNHSSFGVAPDLRAVPFRPSASPKAQADKSDSDSSETKTRSRVGAVYLVKDGEKREENDFDSIVSALRQKDGESYTVFVQLGRKIEQKRRSELQSIAAAANQKAFPTRLLASIPGARVGVSLKGNAKEEFIACLRKDKNTGIALMKFRFYLKPLGNGSFLLDALRLIECKKVQVLLPKNFGEKTQPFRGGISDPGMSSAHADTTPGVCVVGLDGIFELVEDLLVQKHEAQSRIVKLHQALTNSESTDVTLKPRRFNDTKQGTRSAQTTEGTGAQTPPTKRFRIDWKSVETVKVWIREFGAKKAYKKLNSWKHRFEKLGRRIEDKLESFYLQFAAAVARDPTIEVFFLPKLSLSTMKRTRAGTRRISQLVQHLSISKLDEYIQRAFARHGKKVVRISEWATTMTRPFPVQVQDGDSYRFIWTANPIRHEKYQQSETGFFAPRDVLASSSSMLASLCTPKTRRLEMDRYSPKRH